MTAFITHCWKNTRLDLVALLACAMLAGFLPRHVQAEPVAEVTQLRLEGSQDDVLLSAALRFDLPSSVEEALLKGVAVFFVAEAEVYRERWYWADKKVAAVERHMRLVFHPLTRRWRLAVSPNVIANNGLGVILNQTFDSIDDAMAAVRRISGWRIAGMSDIDPGARHRVEFRFRLDVSQLPRPLQIGALGQSDWALSTAVTQRLVLESRK
jgi:hypothetical protein